jgi:putative glutamine amidotransferase
MARPVIGICAAVENAAWAAWSEVEVNISQRTYSQGVTEAGGLPLILPPDDASAESPDQLLGLLDGLLLSGGADIDPASYGAEPDPRTKGFRAERDRFELTLAREALARDLPLLGVCRGMQMLNVACGGTLEQQLADAELHLHTPGQFSDHEVRLEPGSLAARAVGGERPTVRSHHHQGVARLGDRLVATGWAEPGGAIEAIEIPGRWALGILWHAEEERESSVLAALVEAARSSAPATGARAVA